MQINLSTEIFRNTVLMLEIFEIGSIIVLAFFLWKMWKYVRPFKRLITLLAEWDELLTKHEANKAKKEKAIQKLRRELKKLKPQLQKTK